MRYDNRLFATLSVFCRRAEVVAIAGCDGSPPAASPADGNSHPNERSTLETPFHNKKARLEIQCAIDVKRLLKASKLF
ncbi:MAG: hypothetical protein WCE82_08925 [Halobacteriota archaeon]